MSRRLQPRFNAVWGSDSRHFVRQVHTGSLRGGLPAVTPSATGKSAVVVVRTRVQLLAGTVCAGALDTALPVQRVGAYRALPRHSSTTTPSEAPQKPAFSSRWSGLAFLGMSNGTTVFNLLPGLISAYGLVSR
jgi:hypothetical protein